MARDLSVHVPKSIPAVIKSLERMENDVTAAETYEQLRRIQEHARILKIMYEEIGEVRRKAEMVIVLAAHRVGQELQVQEGRRPTIPSPRGEVIPTLAMQVGSTKRGTRLRKLKEFTKAQIKQAVQEIWNQGEDKEATVAGVLRVLRPARPGPEIDIHKLVNQVCKQLDARFVAETDKLEQNINYLTNTDEQLETSDRRRIERSFETMIQRAQRSLDQFRGLERGRGARVVNLRTIENGGDE